MKAEAPALGPVLAKVSRVASWGLAFGCLTATQGCATAVWHPKVDSVSGEYRNTQPLTAKAEDIPEGAADDVKAVVMELPPGMQLDGDVLTVDTARYDVLGRVTAKPAGEFFYPYRESWRRPVCYPQRVLVVATLFVWSLVPTSWPCFISAGTEEDRQDRIVEAMKRATRALGGNMVLVGGFSGVVSIARTSANSAVVQRTEAIEGVGWAIRVKGAPVPTESTSAGQTAAAGAVPAL